jgi:membrane protein YqaA with SNARE-associated domain
LLGLADNSLIPLPGSPGSMDVPTIWFAVHHRHEWLYYAAMAAAGSTLEHRLGGRRATSFYQRYEHRGFWTVAVPAVLPPPFPIVPFLLAAGAFEYSRQRFLAALTLGRIARYTILAYLGVFYGRNFLRFFNKCTKPTVLAALVTYWRYRRVQLGGEVADPFGCAWALICPNCFSNA